VLGFLRPGLLAIGMTHAPGASAQDARAAARARMVAEIAAMARETGGETARPKFGDAVMAAMAKVPRPVSSRSSRRRSRTTIARFPSARPDISQPTARNT
jgi:hypothetical protein